MTQTAIVFVHGTNAKKPRADEERLWRRALKSAGVDLDLHGIDSHFAFYADLFFEASLTPAELADTPPLDAALEAVSEAFAVAHLQTQTELGASSDREFLGDIDLTTVIPQSVVQAVLRPLFSQLFEYFDNTLIKDIRGSKKDVRARREIRSTFVKAVQAARDQVGDEGRVIVLAHSMGSVVAWDCLQHDEDCASVDTLVTIGSPLALDFVQRGLKDANKAAYRKGFPRRLNGPWHNVVSFFDAVARFDTDFQAEFGNSAPHPIKTHKILNPKLAQLSGWFKMLKSAHDLVGYLQHPVMAVMIETIADAALARRARREGLRSGKEHGREDVARLAAERYQAQANTRLENRKTLASGGVSAIEDRERIINRLNLMNYPPEFFRRITGSTNGAGRIDDQALERILGTPDFLSSSFALKAAALTAAVGKIVVLRTNAGPLDMGTGFLVSPHLIMTNNHVIPDKTIGARSQIWFDFSLSSEDQEQVPVKYMLRPDVFFATSPANELDYTLIAVDGPETGLPRPWFQLIEGSGKALYNDYINIIQHPDGRRQEIVLRNGKVVFVDKDTPYAQYEADTQGGSSGSPVCNDEWQLAFLHHSSVARKNASGQRLKKNGEVWRFGDADADVDWIANEGIRISEIVRHLGNQPLSAYEAELLQGCFVDPDLETFYRRHTGTTAGSLEGGGGGFQAGRARNPLAVAQGGCGSMLFEVCLQPVGQGTAFAPRAGNPQTPATAANSASRSLPPPPRAAMVAGPARGLDVDELVGFLLEDAVLEQDYYDPEKDAVARDNYYDGLDLRRNRRGADLFRDLSFVTRRAHTTQFSYTRARHQVLYPWADRHPDNTLRSIYSGQPLSAEEIMRTELERIIRHMKLSPDMEALTGPAWLDHVLDYGDQMPELEAAMPFNTEHVVPQSWFDRRQPMRADLHHLFTCEPGCNSFRSNLPYGDFADFPDVQDVLEAAERDNCGNRDVLDGVVSFEPVAGRGAVARATLYFMLRYPVEVADTAGLFGADRVATLLAWHCAEPVDQYERHRNRAIHLTQGNRNPLVDFPELAAELKWTA